MKRAATVVEVDRLTLTMHAAVWSAFHRVLNLGEVTAPATEFCRQLIVKTPTWLNTLMMLTITV